MNWGYKILLTVIIFILVMVFFVYVSMQQKNELIENNYYEKELAYQSKIDASARLADIMKGKTIATKTQDTLHIIIPIELMDQFSDGKLDFINSQQSSLDRSLVLSPNELGIFNYPVQDFKQGIYLMRLHWKSKGQNYYREENVTLP
jgi:hypothetical protein